MNLTVFILCLIILAIPFFTSWYMITQEGKEFKLEYLLILSSILSLIILIICIIPFFFRGFKNIYIKGGSLAVLIASMVMITCLNYNTGIVIFQPVSLWWNLPSVVFIILSTIFILLN